MLKNVLEESISEETLDAAIKQFYPEFNIAVDQIVCDSAAGKEFAEMIQKRLGLDRKISLAILNHRLMTLRKRGQANGGLPRLQRNYNGRGVNKPR